MHLEITSECCCWKADSSRQNKKILIKIIKSKWKNVKYSLTLSSDSLINSLLSPPSLGADWSLSWSFRTPSKSQDSSTLCSCCLKHFSHMERIWPFKSFRSFLECPKSRGLIIKLPILFNFSSKRSYYLTLYFMFICLLPPTPIWI